MALIHCNFYSSLLEKMSAMYVILPDPPPVTAGTPSVVGPDRPAGRFPTLYLLHGLSDDYTAWVRRTAIERYVEGSGLAVVMPDVQRSFYADMVYGYPYWTFISEELPRLARAWFPLSPKREENIAAGLSMGGYGAFKLALSHPDRYAAAASLSGVLDLANPDEADRDRWRPDLELVFGDPGRVAGSRDDLFALARQVVVKNGPRPKLYQWCGMEDHLYPANLRFRQHATECGLDLTYEEGPGEHEWSGWDRQIRRVLEWLPLES